MKPSFAKINSYNSAPIKVTGALLCSVSFKNRAVPVEFYILPGSCSPILDGKKAGQLKIISLDKDDNHIFYLVLMISSQEKDGEFINNVCSILQHYPQYFKSLGKLQNYQVRFYTDNSIKSLAVPLRSVPYHLKGRVFDVIDNMLKEAVIKEHSKNDPSPWVSCAVIVPKTDSSIRITLDARNINKTIISTIQPIPEQEEIRVQLAGARYFNKLDFKPTFWKLELHPDSCYLTVFHRNDELYQHTRLIMGVKLAQGKLNAALKHFFAYITNVYLIHDDLIIAVKTFNEHNLALEELIKAIDQANLTLNTKECSFGKMEIVFWGMIFSSSGVIRPDPEKVKAFENFLPPKNRSELKSFMCKMQSNSEFIPNFSKNTPALREHLNNDKHYKWAEAYQKIMFKDNFK